MITTQTLHKSLAMRIAETPKGRGGMGQLLSAAIVNNQFRELLLHDPAAALNSGYLGEKFSLGSEEKALIVSIHAESLPDLAKQLTRAMKLQ
jgi:hypothetical protein